MSFQLLIILVLTEFKGNELPNRCVLTIVHEWILKMAEEVTERLIVIIITIITIIIINFILFYFTLFYFNLA